MVGDTRFAAVQELFTQLTDLDVSKRESFIREKCNGQPELERELRTLLATDDHASPRVMTSLFANATRALARHSYEAFVGTRLGSYELASVLGWGGSGVVYLAERVDQQYAAKVAIKIIDESSARCGIERQILATLNHPNIARLIDAGETPEHHPYIIMEYVEGESITRYCDRHQLSIDARLKLFLQVCAAVQYAHRNLIVHRDLKPSNILVAADGTLKLLDFGIAKILPAPDVAAALTHINDRPLTPEYASPEQILGQPITTASDVYALGVILYELLAGVPPYRVSMNEPLLLHRAICEIDPPKPSAAVAAIIDNEQSLDRNTLLEVIAARGMNPLRLRDTLHGDLDAIIMRALRKGPERRYASVEAFAADIQRCLEFEPVKARQGNWIYHSARFVRKHAVAVGAAVIIVVTLAASAVTSMMMYRRAKTERDVATQVANFMGTVFASANVEVNRGRVVTAQELLDQGSDKVKELKGDPAVRFQLLKQMGCAYSSLEQYGKAKDFLDEALKAQELAGTRQEIAWSPYELMSLADTFRMTGEIARAKNYLLQALTTLRSTHNEVSPEYAGVLERLGRVENTQGNLDTAAGYYLKSIEIYRATGLGRSLKIADALTGLARVYDWMNALPIGEKTAREALEIFESNGSENDAFRVDAETVLADIIYQRNQVEEASKLLEDAVARLRRIDKRGSMRRLEPLGTLSLIRERQGKYVEAESLLRQEIAIIEAEGGSKDLDAGEYRTGLAVFLIRRGRYLEAEQELRTALAEIGVTVSGDHQYVADAHHWLGEALLGLHHDAEAINELRKALPIWRLSKAATWLVARSENTLGQALLKTGDRIEGERLLRTSYITLLEQRGEHDDATQLARTRVDALDK